MAVTTTTIKITLKLEYALPAIGDGIPFSGIIDDPELNTTTMVDFL